MKPLLLAFAALMTLTACGADGEPTPPAATPTVSLSGEVRIGVSG